ncbi:MAG: serine/threonine protein kinase [Chloroflexi bacterium]|nr:serine/threonine protein kinase [Chloroflexota bacterium]
MTITLLKPGERLKDRYHIVRVITAGGASAVYEARDGAMPYSPEIRMIKQTLVKTHQARDPHWLEQFSLKYRILHELIHPAILRTYDYFMLRAHVYHVTDLISGQDLAELLANEDHTFPVRTVYGWGLALCDALDYMHTHPNGAIIHRDVKPANIMVDHRQIARLIDFDIAGVFATELTDAPLGSDGYAAPEQYEGVITPAVDVYGLAATLHHLLTGRDPRLGEPFSQVDEPAHTLNPSVSEAFAQVLSRALQPDPAYRFSTARELYDELVVIEPQAEEIV